MSRSPSGCRSLDSLPLFAPDNLLGAVLLGPDRVREWRQVAQMLEARGLPKVDQVMGGRYVLRCVLSLIGCMVLSANVPFAPDGVEDFDGWKQRQKQKRPA